jgi:hypothetical protein
MSVNRRYAYREHEILVSALPIAGNEGWRPEICVITPDAQWHLVPSHEAVVMVDAAGCIEIGRRRAERVIEGLCLDAGRTGSARVLH